MIIETDRMLIRNFTPEDIGDLQEIFGDDETMVNVEPAYSLEKTEKFLNEFCIKCNGALAAVNKNDGKVVGYLLFKPYGEPDVYEIGWIFNRAYWRQELAYEACSGLLRYAFTEMDVQKVFAEAIDGVKSVGLMKKLGMKQEGIQRRQTRDNQGNLVDLYFYGILKEEYQQ